MNSLRALEGAVPQGVPEPRRRPQSAQKIALVLEKAPKHLQPDLIALVPKLVDLSEHSLVAYSLLERLQRPDAEPALRLPVRVCLLPIFCFLSCCCSRFIFVNFLSGLFLLSILCRR